MTANRAAAELLAPLSGLAGMTPRQVWPRIILTMLTIQAGTAAAFYILTR